MSHDLVGKFLSFFDLPWLAGFGGTEGFVPLGSRTGDLSFPGDACPPDLGGLGQKVEIFDGPPLSAPFGRKVPSCPLARGPGAVLLVGRGLIGSSSELTSWIALFGVIACMSISFSSLWSAAVSCWTFDGIADAEFNFLDSFLCSEAGADMVISHNWEAELADDLFCFDFWALIASNPFNKESMVWVNHSSSVLKVFGALMLLVHWCDFDSSTWVFRWVSYRSFNVLPGFTKQNVLLIFHFDDFFFDLPFRATSHIRWMIAITICTFCFIFAFVIFMFSLSTFRTFWLVLAVSFVVAIFLTKQRSGFWYKLFCDESGNQPWSGGYVWTIYGQYVGIWRNQLPIFSSLHKFNFGHTLWLQFIFDVLFIHIAQFFTPNHTSWRIECSVGCHFNRNISLSALSRLSL